jgi:hypothetical protein
VLCAFSCAASVKEKISAAEMQNLIILLANIYVQENNDVVATIIIIAKKPII